MAIMEELLTLKNLLLLGDIPGALLIVEELEEMSRDDIINAIRSHAIVLLLHLLKQDVENRTTRSWDVSIKNSVEEIVWRNRRRKTKGYYLNPQELLDVLDEAYPSAMRKASLEIEGGLYELEKLERFVSKSEVIHKAMTLIALEG